MKSTVNGRQTSGKIFHYVDSITQLTRRSLVSPETERSCHCHYRRLNYVHTSGELDKGRPGRPWTPLLSDCKLCRTVNGHEIQQEIWMKRENSSSHTKLFKFQWKWQILILRFFGHFFCRTQNCIGRPWSLCRWHTSSLLSKARNYVHEIILICRLLNQEVWCHDGKIWLNGKFLVMGYVRDACICI